MKFPLVITCLLASASEAGDLPYPPTYFSEFRTWFSVALDVAEACPGLEIDTTTRDTLTEEQFARLEEDGFTRDNWRKEMRSVPPGIAQRPQIEFYMKYGVKKAEANSFCFAGRKEIEAGSLLGNLLKDTR